jgi:heat shock protein HslJ
VSSVRWFNAIAAMWVIAVAIIALAGCSRGHAALEGTQWRLAEWTLSSLDAQDFDITATFTDGKISGHSGVNSYGGPYALGPGSAFSVGQIASTEMAGPEPAMRAEGAYLTLLGQARSYRVEAGRLTLFDAGGNESLIFDAVGFRPF